jgi:orotate phosphoribosyltransferase
LLHVCCGPCGTFPIDFLKKQDFEVEVFSYNPNIQPEEEYKKRFAKLLAETGALFFDDGLILKDGRPTPYFVNMGMFDSGRLNYMLGEFYADMLVSKKKIDKIDIIFGPSYKGSAIANAIANALWIKYKIDKKFNYDRKEEKTHGEGSKKQTMFVGAKFFDNCHVYLVDDVATSMSTKYEMIDKLKAESERANIKINLVGIGIGIDREQTTAVYEEIGKPILNVKGEDAIADFVNKSGIPVDVVAGAKEIVDYLYSEKIPVKVKGKVAPMPNETKKQFDEYLNTYGISG